MASANLTLTIAQLMVQLECFFIVLTIKHALVFEKMMLQSTAVHSHNDSDDISLCPNIKYFIKY